MIGRLLTLLIAVPCVVAMVGCGGPNELTQNEFAALLVDSSEALSDAEVAFLDEHAARNALLARRVNDFAKGIDLPGWPERAAEDLAEIEALVDEMDGRIRVQTNPAVRDALAPVADEWAQVVGALRAFRTGIVDDDPGARDAAITGFEQAMAELQALDAERVERAVAVIGVDQTRSMLTDQGVDPDAFAVLRASS